MDSFLKTCEDVFPITIGSMTLRNTREATENQGEDSGQESSEIVTASESSECSPLDAQILAVLDEIKRGIAAVSLRLGENPVQEIAQMNARELRRVRGSLSAAGERIENLRGMLGLSLKKPLEEQPTLHDVELDEIELDVLLTVQSRTGLIQRIEIIPGGEERKPVKNQLRETMKANEFAREMFDLYWVSDETVMKNLSDEIATLIEQQGRIPLSNGTSLPVKKLRKEQVPAERAHVNPAKKLSVAFKNAQDEKAKLRRKALRNKKPPTNE